MTSKSIFKRFTEVKTIEYDKLSENTIVDSVNNDRKCKECGQTSAIKKDMPDHKRIHEPHIYTCGLCYVRNMRGPTLGEQ